MTSTLVCRRKAIWSVCGGDNQRRTGAKRLRPHQCKASARGRRFLRSVCPASDGDLPIGLNIKTRGVHFDGSAPSGLEVLLATHPLDDTALLDRARGGMARIPPEVAVDRLAIPKSNYRGLGLRLLAKAQGGISTYAHV